MVAFSAVGPAGGAGAQATASPLTWVHPGTASDTYVAVGVAVDAGPDTGVTVTGVTFGGTPMVSVLRWQSGGAGQTAGFIHAWELFSPPTGSQTVSVTVTGTFTRISGGSAIPLPPRGVP
jgi:hypothetical protein